MQAKPTGSQQGALLSAVRIPTPVGPLVAVVDPAADGALVRLDFVRPDDRNAPHSWRDLAVTWDDPDAAPDVARQIEEYFRGCRRRFDLALSPRGGGPFDREVWQALPELVPFGTTTSYGSIARRLRRPEAARAVGRANATNPISLIVPCHRVVGADGRLVGYGGGEGVATKRALIMHEARFADALGQQETGAGPD